MGNQGVIFKIKNIIKYIGFYFMSERSEIHCMNVMHLIHCMNVMHLILFMSETSEILYYSCEEADSESESLELLFMILWIT